MASLNLQDITIAYLGATVASVTTAAAGGYLWQRLGGQTDYGLVITGTWLATVGGPSIGVATKTLWRKLGEKQPATVRAIGGQRNRRAIPVTTWGKQTHVFMSQLPFVSVKSASENQSDLPPVFTTQIDGNDYSVTGQELDDFLRGAWRRQRNGYGPFSRMYWTKQHRPRLKDLEYYTRINVLLSCDGLILDRAERRSGRLSVPPALAGAALSGKFSLGGLV